MKMFTYTTGTLYGDANSNFNGGGDQDEVMFLLLVAAQTEIQRDFLEQGWGEFARYAWITLGCHLDLDHLDDAQAKFKAMILDDIRAGFDMQIWFYLLAMAEHLQEATSACDAINHRVDIQTGLRLDEDASYLHDEFLTVLLPRLMKACGLERYLPEFVC